MYWKQVRPSGFIQSILRSAHDQIQAALLIILSSGCTLLTPRPRVRMPVA